MYPNIEDVGIIVDGMDNLSTKEKIHLTAIFNSLKHRQEELFENIKEDVKKELSCREQERVDIYTVLVSPETQKDIKDYNFYEICEGIQTVESETIIIKDKEIKNANSYSCGVVYWEGGYEEMLAVINNQYQANIKINDDNYTVCYYLSSTEIFIDREKEIHAVATQYGIETPLIYNPFARRTLEVIINLPCDISKRDKVTIYFDFEKNGLNKLLLNHRLLWNITKKTFDELPDYKTGDYSEILPLWDKEFLIYRFLIKSKNQNSRDFLLVKNNLRAIKRVGEAIYWQMKDSYEEIDYDKISVFYMNKVVLNSIKSQIKYIYPNIFLEPALGDIERIRTKADAMRVVNCFRDLQVICEDVITHITDTNYKIIYTYSKRFDYYQIKDERLCTNSTLELVFKIDPADCFYEDKISYILSYMNHRYPEYKWIGVK